MELQETNVQKDHNHSMYAISGDMGEDMVEVILKASIIHMALENTLILINLFTLSNNIMLRVQHLLKL